MSRGVLIFENITKMNNSLEKKMCYECQMMGLLLITCCRGCIKCFHGVVCDETLRKR
jgi:hypothetical protein